MTSTMQQQPDWKRIQNYSELSVSDVLRVALKPLTNANVRLDREASTPSQAFAGCLVEIATTAISTALELLRQEEEQP